MSLKNRGTGIPRLSNIFKEEALEKRAAQFHYDSDRFPCLDNRNFNHNRYFDDQCARRDLLRFFVGGKRRLYRRAGAKFSHAVADPRKSEFPGFCPGDNILFKCGDSWQGSVTISSSGTTGNPITYGPYGAGASPVIKGTVAILSPWTQYSGSIFETAVAQNIDRVFLNGQPLTLARYPNTGYLAITDTLNSTTLTSNLLNAVDWTNATVHVRTMHWTIASKKIVSCNTAGKSLTLNAAPVYGLKPGWGFFINNALQALDTAGEWYYDSLGQKLYVWTPGNDSPANYTVEGSTYQTGFSMNGKSFVTIQGFTITGQAQYGIFGNNVSNVILMGNRISFADAEGIYLNGPNCIIQSDTIEGSSQNGVETNGASLTFSGNVVRDIALIRNFTKNGLGDLCCSGLGLEADGGNAQVLGNAVDSIGYIGLEPNGANDLIENNFIRHCCLTKDDGGGIYTGWQSDSAQTGCRTVIRDNIVLGSQSAPEGTPDVGYTPAKAFISTITAMTFRSSGTPPPAARTTGFFSTTTGTSLFPATFPMIIRFNSGSTNRPPTRPGMCGEMSRKETFSIPCRTSRPASKTPRWQRPCLSRRTATTTAILTATLSSP